MCGYKPGGGSRNEVTWRRVKNTVSERLEDDSLVHLYTSKKKIKRRTKLLNSYLREIPARHIITYNDYIKAKTAVLRTLSEDEETDDEAEVDTVDNCETPSIDSQKNALRTLLNEMMLESADSGDEFQEKPQKFRKVINKRVVGKSKGKIAPRNSGNSSKLINDSSLPMVPKRGRGRPRKVASNNEETPKDIKQEETHRRSTSTLEKLWRNREGKISSSEDELIPQNSRNIVEVMINNDSNGKSTSPIYQQANLLDQMDPLANELKIENQSSPDQSKFVAFEKKLDVIEDEEEFLTPNTSDCDDDDEKLDLSHSNQHISENSMNNDDMFEEEKVVTQSSFNIPEKTGECNEKSGDEKYSNIPIDGINSGEHSSVIVKESLVGDEKNPENIHGDEVEESLTQLIDINREESIDNIDDHIEESDDKYSEEGSPPQLNDEPKKKMSTSREKSLTPADINKSNREKLNDSNVKMIVSPTNKRILNKSRKIAADVKKNLMATLNDVDEETRKGVNNEKNQIEPDSPNSKENDHRASIGPVDSGIDDDSNDALIQEYLRLKREEEGDTEGDNDEMTTPMKKKLNLKITCTEVVKSKYMIIRGDEEVCSDLKHSAPEEGRVPKRRKNKSLDHSTLSSHRRDGDGKIGENNFTNSNNQRESPVSSDEGGNDISLRWETEDEGHQNMSFKDQLADYDNSEDDYGADRDSNVFGINNYEVNDRSEGERKNRTLSAPTESESLKWVLDSLAGRKKTYDNFYQAELNPDEEESALTEPEGTSDDEDFTYERLPRPTSIPEFIEGTNLMPLDLAPSFTLADIDDDDDIYLLEIPKSIVEQNLKDQRFSLKKRKIIIGGNRYDIQKKECEPLSCILHSGDRKNRYKTGTIEPLQHIIVRQQVRDDVFKTPKLEPEARKSVPFPSNIKSRNPLILPEEEERRESLFPREAEHLNEMGERPQCGINQDDVNYENENRGKQKKLKKSKKPFEEDSAKIIESDSKSEIEEKWEVKFDSSSVVLDSKDLEGEKKIRDCEEASQKLENCVTPQKNSDEAKSFKSPRSDGDTKVNHMDSPTMGEGSVLNESVNEESEGQTKKKKSKRRKITEEVCLEISRNEAETEAKENLEAELENSFLKVPEDAAGACECIEDDSRVCKVERKFGDSKESLKTLEAEMIVEASLNTSESPAFDEGSKMVDKSIVLNESVNGESEGQTKKKKSKRRKITEEVCLEVSRNEAETEAKENLEAELENSFLKVPEDAAGACECIEDDSRVCKVERKFGDSKESLKTLEAEMIVEASLNTSESPAFDEGSKIADKSIVLNESVNGESEGQTKKKKSKRRKITEEVYLEVSRNEAETEAKENLEAELENSFLKVPEDAAGACECIEDDSRVCKVERKFGDSKESLKTLEAEMIVEASLNTSNNKSTVLNEFIEEECNVPTKTKTARRCGRSLDEQGCSSVRRSDSDMKATRRSSQVDDDVKVNAEFSGNCTSSLEKDESKLNEDIAIELNTKFKVPRKKRKSKRRRTSTGDSESPDSLQNDSDASLSEAESNFKAKRRKRNDSVNSVGNLSVELMEKKEDKGSDEAALPKKSFYAQMME